MHVPFAIALVGCGSPEAPEPAAEAPPEQIPEAVVGAERHVVEVHLELPVIWTGVHQPTELAGLLTALVEGGLGDLADVAPVVTGLPMAPGLEGRLTTHAEVWTGRLGVSEGEGDQLRYGLVLCDAEGTCSDIEAKGTRDAPAVPIAELLHGAAATLGRSPLAEAEAAWAQPQSLDGYAVLVCGRGAATFYGLRAPVAEEDHYDQHKDPMARAVYIDPAMTAGWWMVGRDAATRADWQRAREAFTRSTLDRPSSILPQADEATALAALGKWDQAWQAWQSLDERAPGDPRFAVPRARAALESEHVTEALAILDALPTPFQDERPVAELRVAIAEATGASSNYDELLASWQQAAPHDPEPVRRRIRLRVEDGRYSEARELVVDLRVRGEPSEADKLAVALDVGLGELEGAAKGADRLGWPDVAARVRARAALEADPKASSAVYGMTDPIALVVGGDADLAGGHADWALIEADRALEQEPWMPEALDVRARALDALGRGAEASETRERLRQADPDYAP